MTPARMTDAQYARLTSGARPRQPRAKRAPRLPGPKERDVVRAVLGYLKAAGVPAWRNNAGRFTNAKGRSFAMAPPGSADVLGCLPGGRFLAVELKRPGGGKLTDAQSRWLRGMEAQGALCVVARSAADVYTALKAAGYAVAEPKAWVL